jgi:hypothetical protein
MLENRYQHQIPPHPPGLFLSPEVRQGFQLLPDLMFDVFVVSKDRLLQSDIPVLIQYGWVKNIYSSEIPLNPP